MPDDRIVIDQFGLDEIVLSDVDVHVERMEPGIVWMAFTRRGETELKRIAIKFSSRGKAVRCAILENDTGIAPQQKRDLR